MASDTTRAINLVIFILISLAFIYGFGKQGAPSETIIPT